MKATLPAKLSSLQVLNSKIAPTSALVGEVTYILNCVGTEKFRRSLRFSLPTRKRLLILLSATTFLRDEK